MAKELQRTVLQGLQLIKIKGGQYITYATLHYVIFTVSPSPKTLLGVFHVDVQTVPVH